MCRLVNRFDERGYTLIESLFQLIILAIFVQFFLFFFLWKVPIEQQHATMAGTDWELFAVDLQHLLSEVQEINIYFSGQGFTLVNERGMIDIDQGNGVIRKRVYGLGHVPLLTNVRSVIFSLEDLTIYADVTLLDGTRKERGFAVGLYPE